MVSQNGSPQKKANRDGSPQKKQRISDRLIEASKGVSVKMAEQKVGRILSDAFKENMGRMEPGKPGGAPPYGRKLSTDITDLLAMRATGKKAQSRQKKIAEKFVKMMEAGEFAAIKEWMDRTEGKPTQPHTVDENSVKLYVGINVDGDESP